MARYKDYCYEQGKMIPMSFREQILPGTFEYTLSYLIDHELDLSVFDQRYGNDDTGRPAYDPALLLKIVLYAYARGIVSSRQIERCCRKKVDAQWKLYCIVHNVLKIHRYGMGLG